MTKCLVTRFNGVCSNESLPIVGHFKIKVLKDISPETSFFCITVFKNTTATIIGNGYFTDSTFTSNEGKVLYLSSGVQNKFYVKAVEDCYVDIADKDAIYQIIYLPINSEFDLANLKYSKVEYVWAFNSQVYGDIKNIENLNLVCLNLNNTAVTGDISVLKNLTGLETLILNNTAVTGDISVLKNLTGLKDSIFTLHSRSKLYGNVGALPDSLLCLHCSKNGNDFTWTSSDRTKILALNGVECSTIDALLNGMKDLTAEFGGSQMWFKNINLYGTRTSASDAAVATLQSKGYTVSITPA